MLAEHLFDGALLGQTRAFCVVAAGLKDGTVRSSSLCTLVEPTLGASKLSWKVRDTMGTCGGALSLGMWHVPMPPARALTPHLACRLTLLCATRCRLLLPAQGAAAAEFPLVRVDNVRALLVNGAPVAAASAEPPRLATSSIA